MRRPPGGWQEGGPVVMVVARRQARALGDPARYRLFGYLAEAAAPVGVAELTAMLGLSHNTVRQHLAVLGDAGLISEERQAGPGPGRPRLLYRADPEAAGRWAGPGPYAWLAGVLTRAIAQRQDVRQAGRAEGRRRAAALPRPVDPASLLAEQMARLGFRPRRTDHGRRVSLVLGNCPVADLAATEPRTICQLHLGLAEGLADGVGGLAVERLVSHDAHDAGCRLMLQRAPGPRHPPRSAGGR